MKAKETNKTEQELIPAAPYDAICYGVVDLGTHQPRNPTYKPSRKVMFFFELPEITITYTDKNGKEVTAPRSIKQDFIFSMGSKNLRKFIEPWVGKKLEEVDFSVDVLGRPAAMSVIHNVSESNGKTYANIGTVGPMKQRDIDNLPPQYNKNMLFDIDEHGFESKQFTELYGWLQEEIKKSEEYQRFVSGPEHFDAPSAPDDIPFDIN